MSDHSHSHDSGTEHSDRPQYDDVNSSLVLMVGLVSAIVTFLIIGFVQGVAYRWESSFTQDNVLSVNQEVRKRVEEQKAILSNTKDPQGASQAGRITIDDAISKVLQQFGGDSATGVSADGGTLSSHVASENK